MKRNDLTSKLLLLLITAMLLVPAIGPQQAAAHHDPASSTTQALSLSASSADSASLPSGGIGAKGTPGDNGDPLPPSSRKGVIDSPTPSVKPPVAGLIDPAPHPTRVPDRTRNGGDSQSSSDIESQLLVQTNAARRAHGVPPLHQNANLTAASHWLAGDMAARNYFNHTDSLGRTFDVRLAQFGYWHGQGGIAENIAAGYADVPSVVAAWLASPGHAANMLNPVYREIGVGYGENTSSTYDTYWVQDFGFTPNVYPVIINDGQPQTNSSQVHLYIYGSGWATEMQVSNDPNFTGASWQPYQSELDWQLLPGSGVHSVYVMLRAADGSTAISTDSTVVNLPPTSTPLPATPCPGQLFPDLPCNYWDYNAIQSLAQRGIISGMGDGNFHPHDAVTRAQFAKMVVIANGWTLLTPATPHFSDVPASYWAYAFIESAYANGVISGYPDGTFHPSATLSRDQLAKIIVRALGYDVYNPPTPSFTDVPASYWAYGFIEQAHHLSIVNGYPDGSFKPTAIGKRDELSAILYDALYVAPATPTP